MDTRERIAIMVFFICLIYIFIIIKGYNIFYVLFTDGDSEYSQKGSYIIPEVIKNFLNFFQLHIQEKNVYEIQNAYEEGSVLFFLSATFM